MNWRSTAQILLSFVLAGLAVWVSPLLFDRIGLGEFTFVGQLASAMILLSMLELVFRRWEDAPDHG
jgi:hypothetical protein